MKILFFHRGMSGFIERDLILLREAGEVLDFDAARMGIQDYLRAFFLARKARSHILYCWFAGRHAVFPAFLARLWGTRFVIVGGGWDVAKVPEIGYGLMRTGWKKPLAQWILRSAHRVLSVSDSNHRELLEHTGIGPEKLRVIVHGVEVPNGKIAINKKEDLVLTVGEVTISNLKRKGIETFIKSARLLPDKQFYLVGLIKNEARPFLKAHASSNLTITDYLSPSDLNRLFARASVYVQVSYHEAFGSAVAEAMAYGCVPVVTRQYALPEVVGPCGIYVPYGDPEKTAEGIRQAFRSLPTLSRCAQERVARLFPLEARREALVKLFKEVADEP